MPPCACNPSVIPTVDGVKSRLLALVTRPCVVCPRLLLRPHLLPSPPCSVHSSRTSLLSLQMCVRLLPASGSLPLRF